MARLEDGMEVMGNWYLLSNLWTTLESKNLSTAVQRLSPGSTTHKGVFRGSLIHASIIAVGARRSLKRFLMLRSLQIESLDSTQALGRLEVGARRGWAGKKLRSTLALSSSPTNPMQLIILDKG